MDAFFTERIEKKLFHMARSLLCRRYLCRCYPSPLTSAEQSRRCHSQKLTNDREAFKFRWLGSSPRATFQKKMADLKSAFKVVCEKLKIEAFNDQQTQALHAFIDKKQDLFINLPTGFGKSFIYQALPLIYDEITGVQGHIVVVVSPLVNLTQDQVANLQKLNIPAVSLSEVKGEEEVVEEKKREIEDGEFSLIYATPESLILNERWRKMLTNFACSSRLCAIAIDEAHVIKQWGTSNTTDKAVFRECYSRLHELRSLAPGVKMLALTATATSSTKAAILDILLMENPHVIYESPDKSNIAYSVLYMSRDDSIQAYFEWLVKDLLEHGTETTRTIIYCQTIRQCSLIYAILKGMLRDSLYVGEVKDRRRVLVEMLHSCTPTANKESVLKAFGNYDSELRVLVATIAFGMGVNCTGVYRVIHFGPSKNIEAYIQETGRGGRDGKQSVAYIIYQGLLLNHVEKDIKLYLKSEECRRKVLISQFDNCNQINYPKPKHLCCDNCSKNCNCKSKDCGQLTQYPGCVDKTKEKETKTGPTRLITEQQRTILSVKLASYHRTLVRDVISKSPYGKLPTLTNLQFMLGFSDRQIDQVLKSCHKIFSLKDVMSYVEIWHFQHAVKIIDTINSMFGDCDIQRKAVAQESYVDEEDDDNDDIESDTWLGDWDMLIDDEELFELAVENLSMSLLEASLNDSHESTLDGQNIPTAAVSALDHLRIL